MRKRAWLMVAFVMLAAAGAVGAADTISQCPGGDCKSKTCSVCCVATDSPSCSLLKCKCVRNSVSVVDIGPGSILER